MEKIIILGLITFFLLYIVATKASNKGKHAQASDTEPEETAKSLPIEGAYQKSWLFSRNEKDAYQKLRALTDEAGYTVLAKVRLLDLLEPIRGNPKYKTYFYKIQSKHVDFVLCDEKLVARTVIELDDSSHNSKTRQQRDEFVDEVLTSVGYAVIHVKAITADLKSQLFQNA